MQDHFIKNVNDLSLCMTFICDRSGANTSLYSIYTTANASDGPCSSGEHYAQMLQGKAFYVLLPFIKDTDLQA